MTEQPLPADSRRDIFAKVNDDRRTLPPFERCIEWLDRTGLTLKDKSFRWNGVSTPARRDVRLGVPCERSKRGSRSEFEAFKKKCERQTLPGFDISPEALQKAWTEYRDRDSVLAAIDLTPISPDALAFYRPFHVAPYREWGIYILVEELVLYWCNLQERFSGKLFGFTPDTLLACLLFDVFHHEFFHYLVECSATTLEIVSARFGDPLSIYQDYLEDKYEQTIGVHPEKPLEEALANAYAFNSFSFISRVKIGHKHMLIRLYQAVLKTCWRKERDGYNKAANYTGPDYVRGAAQLLAMLLPSKNMDPGSLLLLGKNVLLSGHTAFLDKPNIPTYLVGHPDTLERFYELVPYPVDTYTALFFPGNTDPIDKYFQEQARNLKEAKKK